MDGHLELCPFKWDHLGWWASQSPGWKYQWRLIDIKTLKIACSCWGYCGTEMSQENNCEVKGWFGQSVMLLKQNPSSPSLNWIQLWLYSPAHTSMAVNFLYSQGHRMYLFLMKLVPSCTNLPLHILGTELFSPEILQNREAGVMMVTKPCCSTPGSWYRQLWTLCLGHCWGTTRECWPRCLTLFFIKHIQEALHSCMHEIEKTGLVSCSCNYVRSIPSKLPMPFLSVSPEVHPSGYSGMLNRELLQWAGIWLDDLPVLCWTFHLMLLMTVGLYREKTEASLRTTQGFDHFVNQERLNTATIDKLVNSEWESNKSRLWLGSSNKLWFVDIGYLE